MSDDQGAAEAVPPVNAHIERVQPCKAATRDLGAPVSSAEVLLGVAPDDVDETRQMQENLERRAADQQLRDEMAKSNFTGKLYGRFEHELARYGMSVLRGWMHSGYVFHLTSARGFALHPSAAELEELHRDSDAREDLAIITVAVALTRFRERALVAGGWRYEGGATLSTFFMGACLYVFPNEFRKRRVQRKKWLLQDGHDPAVTAPQQDHITNPAVLTLGSMRVHDDLQRLDTRTRAIVELTLDGYTQEEIVELLDETSIRAVEGVLYRWRTKEQALTRAGGD